MKDDNGIYPKGSLVDFTGKTLEFHGDPCKAVYVCSSKIQDNVSIIMVLNTPPTAVVAAVSDSQISLSHDQNTEELLTRINLCDQVCSQMAAASRH